MRLLPLWLLVFLSTLKGEVPANWTADYPPCNRHAELLKQGHMDIGVRLDTANRILAQQFRLAMDSWAIVLDLDWHEEDTQNCSIEVVDGDRGLFESAPRLIVARSQFPDRLDFQGWIAFNPAQTLGETELFWTAVHEIGHMLGLPHSLNAKSVMYGLTLDGIECLDPIDLAALAAHHKLRVSEIDKPFPFHFGVSEPRQ
jgi:hypothetical protein